MADFSDIHVEIIFQRTELISCIELQKRIDIKVKIRYFNRSGIAASESD